MKHAGAEQIELGAPITLTFDQLEASDVTLDRTAAQPAIKFADEPTWDPVSATIGCCTLVSTREAVTLFMALSFFGKGVGSLGWAVGTDTSPREAAGLSGALFNTFANLAGITTPIVIGYIVELTGSFDWALLYVLANAIGAILSFVFITGTIQRVTLRHTAGLAAPAGVGLAH